MISEQKALKNPIWRRLIGASVVCIFIALSIWSVFVGVADLSIQDVISGDLSKLERDTLFISRIPRTMAIILSATAMSVAGLVMQLVVRNRFVEPSTTGTTAGASAGVLLVLLFAPGAPIVVKLSLATGCALITTGLFLLLIANIPARQTILVPLVGIMAASIIEALISFVAIKNNLLQALGAWTTGNFAPIIAGRYELLYLVAGVTFFVWIIADRLTILSLGEETAVNLGLSYKSVRMIGLAMVALTSSIVITVIGSLPFLGLVVPNLVSLSKGDHLRSSIFWVAITGSILVLVADIFGRIVVHPYELPIGTTLGVMCSFIFIVLLMKLDDGRG